MPQIKEAIRTIKNNGDIVLSNMLDSVTNESVEFVKVIDPTGITPDGYVYRRMITAEHGEEIFVRADFRKDRIVNFTWFGVSTASPNNKAAFDRAFAFTGSNSYYLPDGTFLVDWTRPARSGVYIQGAGIGKTIIKSCAIGNTTPFSVGNADDVDIRDITFDGNGTIMPPPSAGDGAQAFSSSITNRLNLLRCEFLNAYNKTVTCATSNYTTFNECLFDTGGDNTRNQDQIQIYGGTNNCNNNKILNCTFYNPIRASIYLETNVTNTEISGNKFINNIGSAGAVAVHGQVFGDGLNVFDNYIYGTKYAMLLRCGFKNANFINNRCYFLKTAMVSIQGQQAVYDSASGEAAFPNVREAITIDSVEYVYLVKNLSVRDNTCSFNETLNEANVASICNFIGLSTTPSYFGNITIANNTILANSLLTLGRLFYINLQAGICKMSSLVINNKNVVQQKSGLIFQLAADAPDVVKCDNNTIQDLGSSQSLRSNKNISIAGNTFINFNYGGGASGGSFGSITAPYTAIQDNQFIGDGIVSYINNPPDNATEPTHAHVIKRNIDQTGKVLGYFVKADQKIPLANIQRFGSSNRYYWLDSNGVQRSSNTLPVTFFAGDVEWMRGNTKSVSDNATTLACGASTGILLANTVATRIGVVSSDNNIIRIIFTTANSTIVSGSFIKLAGGKEFTGAVGDTLTLIRDLTLSANNWYEVGRSTAAVKSGTFTVAGTGQATINIPHNTSTTPTFSSVLPKSADARSAGITSWTENATNIVITITTPNTGGTLTYSWLVN